MYLMLTEANYNYKISLSHATCIGCSKVSIKRILIASLGISLSKLSPAPILLYFRFRNNNTNAITDTQVSI